MAIFATNERLTFNDIKRESGTVGELVAASEKYIKNNIRWRVEFDGSIERKEIPEIPIDAIREALVNSYCHRDYRSSQNNEVAIYKNRIEIYNPGSFPQGLTPQDFIDGSERSIKRNPQLAQMLYYSKDIEAFGTGLRRITESCEKAGTKVEFQILKMGFAVIFYRDNNDINGTVNGIVNNKNNILKVISDSPKITYDEISEQLNIPRRTIAREIKALREQGIIQRIGSDKSGYWKIKGNNTN